MSKTTKKPLKKAKKLSARHLVVVESPAKAKTIEKFLGRSYVVRASYGHVRDLPKTRLGIDVDDNFLPKYIALKDKKAVLKELKTLAEAAPTVYLATDPDREGEAIAWHVQESLDTIDTDKFKRIVFSEITKTSVQRSIEHARDIDQAMVDAQQARRVLDRLIGYSLSPILGKKIQRGLSAGRVQSVSVKLICERDAQIAAFVPEEFWVITSTFDLGNQQTLQCLLIAKDTPKNKLIISNESMARSIESDLNQSEFHIDAITTKPIHRQPKPPFITSSLQQESSRWFGWTAKKTMSVAQQLYEGIDIGNETVGLITYMRTDSVRIADEALHAVRDYVSNTYGKPYLNPRVFKTKGNAQDAHEAIRPSYVTHPPDHIDGRLSPDQKKLYRLVWNRFVASQMTACELESTQVLVKTNTHYYLKATGSRIVFDGFKKVYEEKTEEVSDSDSQLLPKLSDQQALPLQAVDATQKFTQPPPRYTEASLIKTLEQEGIGRPSTYAPTISTIQDRGYVEKNGRQLISSELGQIVNTKLSEFFDDILNVKFTANLETQLDEVMAGDHDWHSVVQSFYDPFSKQISLADTQMEKVNRDKPTDKTCELCDSPMVIKVGRYGEFTACSSYYGIVQKSELNHSVYQQLVDSHILNTLDDTRAQLTQSAKGIDKNLKFLSDNQLTDVISVLTSAEPCKNILKEKKTIISTGVHCPECKKTNLESPIVERKTRRGKLFFGCSAYPKCTFALWDRPIQHNCTKCDSTIVLEKEKKDTKTWHCIACETEYVLEN